MGVPAAVSDEGTTDRRDVWRDLLRDHFVSLDVDVDRDVGTFGAAVHSNSRLHQDQIQGRILDVVPGCMALTVAPADCRLIAWQKPLSEPFPALLDTALDIRLFSALTTPASGCGIGVSPAPYRFSESIATMAIDRAGPIEGMA